jgi:hypothetical protein
VALDISFRFVQEYLFLILTQFKHLSQLTMNVKMTSSKMILTNEFRDRFFFDRYVLQNQVVQVQPEISLVTYLTKYNITTIDLTKVMPP